VQDGDLSPQLTTPYLFPWRFLPTIIDDFPILLENYWYLWLSIRRTIAPDRK
jgi:hypothetical protein